MAYIERTTEETKPLSHCTLLLFAEEALREERFFFFLEERGEEGREMEEGGGEGDMAEESGETERLLVGLLLGEPRGDE